jgi:hypothetical protein
MRQPRAKYWVGFATVLAVLVAAAPSDAHVKRRRLKDPGRDYTQGGFQLYFGFGGQGYEIEDNDYSFLDEFDSEGLFFVGAAVGLDRGLALYFEGSGSEHDTPVGDMTFGYAHVGLKYAPNTGRRHRWQPYGKASVGAVFLFEDDDRHYLRRYDRDDDGYFGPSIGLAAGVDRFISRRTALFAEVGLLFGELDHVVVDGEDVELADDVGVSSGRLLFGIRFRL